MEMLKYVILLLLITGGCSSETIKRGTYETLENVRMNKCENEFSANCTERESYDGYTRKRDGVVK